MAPQLGWMVIGADTAPELATAKANGATHGLIEVFWDQVQGSLGGTVTTTGVQTAIQTVLDAGLKVCLRANLQYIPAFVDTAAVKFRRNGSVDYNPGNVSGNNARDWVWSASTRALVDDYLTKLFTQLDWSKIDRVQLGGGPAGELQYPDSDGTQWWGFSAPAQTGTDLAAGQSVCPVPGHVPSTGTTWVANDVAFASWYTASIRNWMLWLIAKHRAYYSGPIWVMHPGAGLRKVSQTPTGSQALNYRVNLAKGVDWDDQVAAYPDAGIHPYCTWSDADHFAGQPYSDVNDGDAAPWYHLLRVARRYGRAARIWGENTGGQSNTDMDRVFSTGAVAHGYQGLVWLSHDSLADGTSDTYANWATRITAATKAYGDYRRGINLAGGEFAPAAATLPGVYGTDYSYDGATAVTNVAARGHKIVRVPFRWERIQPTRNAALNAAELTRLQGVVSSVQSAGMRAVLDCHNYARYINSTANGGAELVLGSAQLPVADLVDLWTRLSTAFKGNVGVHGYGLMNEPHDLTAVAGTLSGTTRYDWNDGTVQGWTGDTATASNVGSKLRLAATISTGGFFQFRKDDAATLRNNTATGNALQAEITLGAGVFGSWSAKLQWQNQAFSWIDAPTVTYTRIDTGATVGGLIAGVAVRVTASHSSITTPRAFAIQVEANNAAAGSVSVDVDNFAQGTVSGGATPAQVWENAAQQCVTAIRGNADTTKIFVSGYNWSGARNWRTTHPTAWITDSANNHAYEAHYYFDVDNSGDYPDSYATENTAAVSAGYTDLASRAVTELQNWTTWLVANGVRGLLGEVGWPNTADTASWNAVGEALYREADLHAVEVAYWSGGARWGTTYNLSIYTGTNQDTIKSQAATVESHPSSVGGAVAVAYRAATDDARGVTTSAQPALPTGVVEGDLLICVQTSDLNGTAGAMLAPDGSWAQVGSFTRADVGTMKVWRKTATASEPATYTFQDSTSAHGSAIIIAVTGQDVNTPLAVTPTFASGAAATLHPAPSVAGVTDGLLITAHLAGTAGTTRDYTAPTGMTTAQKSSLTTGANILTGAYYLTLPASGQTGAKSATCTASTPYVTMALVVAPVAAAVTVTPATAGSTGTAQFTTGTSESFALTANNPVFATGKANAPTVSTVSTGTTAAGRGSATGKADNPTVTISSSTSTTVTAGATASGTAYGSNTGAVFGFNVVSSVPQGSAGLFPSETLFPSDGLFPSAGEGATAQTVSPPGIGTAEAVGSPAVSVADGPQDVIATSIGSAEAIGVPTVTADAGPQDITAVGGIDATDAFGRPSISVEVGTPPPPPPAARYLDTYYVDGIDLAQFTTQIEIAEGLQDTPGTFGDDVALPGRDGLLEVWGGPGQQRRPDGPGKVVFSMWLLGVDPVSGNLLDPADSAAAYMSRWDELVRMFHRRRITIDHPRPDGTRRAVGYLTPQESMAPTSRAASPWFGRFKASVTIPAGHWTDPTEVTTGPTPLANNGVLSLAPWVAATAPCTELVITFGSGNNPRLSTSYGFVGWNGTIAPGRELTIDTASGQLGYGGGQVWTPAYDGLVYSPGPRLFEIDPSEPLQAVLTHTGGGSMTVEVSGKRRYRTS